MAYKLILTKSTVRFHQEDSNCVALFVDEEENHLLCGFQNGFVKCFDTEKNNEILWEHQFLSEVSSIIKFNQWYLIGSQEGIHILNEKGHIVDDIASDAGVFSINILDSSAFIFDNFGRVNQLLKREENFVLVQLFQDLEIEHFFFTEHSLFLIHQGRVAQTKNGEIIWTRPQRGDIGERILSIDETKNGTIAICREGHAYVDGEEEVLEIEWWQNQECIHRMEVQASITASNVVDEKVLFGCDDGTIATSSASGEWEVLSKKEFPIQDIVVFEDQTLFSWWFYLTGLEHEREWIVEHSGMIQMLALCSKTGTLFFSGSDQNDYTESEPIGMIRLGEEAVEVDKSELTTWFESDVQEITSDEIYSSDEKMLQHLSKQEQDLLQAEPDSKIQFSSLLDAMNEDVLQLIDNDALREEDILLDLLLDESIVRSPSPNAGEDSVVKCDEQGNAIIHLDASNTQDPDEQINSMQWVDHLGNTISTSFQCKVKLPIGTYRFEFRIRDKNGIWSTDSISVKVER